MKARRVLEGASFDPDTLKVICRAFDEAWDSIAHHYGSPLEVEHARLRLANSMLAIAQGLGHDVEALKNAAFQDMAMNYRDRSDPMAANSN